MEIQISFIHARDHQPEPLRTLTTRSLRTSKNLITALAAEHHFYAHGFDFPTEKVHRRARAHGSHVERLEVIDHVRNCVETLLDGEHVLVVHCTEVVRRLARGEQVWRVFEADREGV